MGSGGRTLAVIHIIDPIERLLWGQGVSGRLGGCSLVITYDTIPAGLQLI